MLVLTIAIGVDRASLAWAAAAPAPARRRRRGPRRHAAVAAASPSTCSASSARFDLAVDAFGLLCAATSASTCRASSASASPRSRRTCPTSSTSPPRASRSSTTRQGPRSQELLRINSATVFFPKLNVRGMIKPFDPNIGRNVDDTGQTTRRDPGPGRPAERLHDRHRRARLRHRRPERDAVTGRPAGSAAAATTPPPAATRRSASAAILEFDDLRDRRPELRGQLRRREPGRLRRHRSSSPPAASTLLPGQAVLGDDHRPHDGRRPQPGRHAERPRRSGSTLEFEDGHVKAFKFNGRHAQAQARLVRDAHRARLHPRTPARAPTEELVVVRRRSARR